MDPLSALGIAAAVIQFVDFGQRLFSETWHIYRSPAGESLELRQLSVVSHDLTGMSEAVRNALSLHRGSSSSMSFESDQLLLRVCRKCDAIAKEIDSILPQIDECFKMQLENEKGVNDGAFPTTNKAFSVGNAFRKALRIMRKGKHVEALKINLSNVRQEIIMATTWSTWLSSRDSIGWEKEFSNKLDIMIETLDRTVKKTMDMGPSQRLDGSRDSDGASHEESQTPKMEAMEPIEPSVKESIRRSKVAKEIIDRLWKKGWEPEPWILSTCPQNSSLEASQSAIIDSLFFATMDNREEAIPKTFESTYQWLFSQTPTLSDAGEPMWSSLPDWLESNSKLPYWVTGKPGAGKSTAMKYIANHPESDRFLSTWAQGLPVYKIKYYAWKPGLDLSKSVEGLHRTLLYQALRNNPDLTPTLCPRRWALIHMVDGFDGVGVPPWRDWELRESFSSLLDSTKDRMRLAIFVDGLDEFAVAPMELCSLIRDIAQHGDIKVCVASRSWPQFSDAFADSPEMQMHLLTYNDINNYVFEHFRGTRAFLELNSLYQNGGDTLLNELIAKSDGVFLWTAIVTSTIYQSMIEGASLPQLQSILDRMPPEIENLYDAIYSTIPKRLLPEVSVMLQIFSSACKPVDFMTLWLADETRGEIMSIDIHTLNGDQVQTALKRRLGARTRGLLDTVPSTKTVDFLHRTADEWIRTPRVWEQLRSVSPANFDPHMCLLRAETIQMDGFTMGYSPFNTAIWMHISSSLLYASLVDDTISTEQTLVEAVDQLHQAANWCFSSQLTPKSSDGDWPAYQRQKDITSSDRPLLHNSFHGLAVQYAILPYIRRKFDDSPSEFHPVPTKGSRPLLEQSIFGPRRYTSSTGLEGVDIDKITRTRRLEVVAFLLSRGIRQPGIESLVAEAKWNHKTTYGDSGLQYFADVKKLLTCNKSFLGGKGASSLKDRFESKMRKWFS